jgi:hypothetical protein
MLIEDNLGPEIRRDILHAMGLFTVRDLGVYSGHWSYSSEIKCRVNRPTKPAANLHTTIGRASAYWHTSLDYAQRQSWSYATPPTPTNRRGAPWTVLNPWTRFWSYTASSFFYPKTTSILWAGEHAGYSPTLSIDGVNPATRQISFTLSDLPWPITNDYRTIWVYQVSPRATNAPGTSPRTRLIDVINDVPYGQHTISRTVTLAYVVRLETRISLYVRTRTGRCYSPPVRATWTPT